MDRLPSDHPVREFLQALHVALAEILDETLTAIYVHGSVAMASFVTGRSDIDIIVVVARHLDVAEKSAIVRAVWRLEPPEGSHGVEVRVVVAEDLTAAETMDRSELLVSRHPGEPVTRDSDRDAELIVDLITLLEKSLVVFGPAPTDLVAPIDKTFALRVMVDKMKQNLGEEPEAYAVLNAARTLAFESTGHHVSKIEGGRWAIERGQPRRLLERAIEVQQGERVDRPLTQEGRRFIHNVIHIIEDELADRIR